MGLEESEVLPLKCQQEGVLLIERLKEVSYVCYKCCELKQTSRQDHSKHLIIKDKREDILSKDLRFAFQKVKIKHILEVKVELIQSLA